MQNLSLTYMEKYDSIMPFNFKWKALNSSFEHLNLLHCVPLYTGCPYHRILSYVTLQASLAA